MAVVHASDWGAWNNVIMVIVRHRKLNGKDQEDTVWWRSRATREHTWSEGRGATTAHGDGGRRCEADPQQAMLPAPAFAPLAQPPPPGAPGAPGLPDGQFDGQFPMSDAAAAEAAGRAATSGDRRVWTTEEDEAIRTLVTRYGTRSWSVIAEHIISDYNIIGRTGKQCRERWHNHLGTPVS